MFTNSTSLASQAVLGIPRLCLTSGWIAGRLSYLCRMHMDAEDSNSIPPPCTAITLSTESSPQP